MARSKKRVPAKGKSSRPSRRKSHSDNPFAWYIERLTQHPEYHRLPSKFRADTSCRHPRQHWVEYAADVLDRRMHALRANARTSQHAARRYKHVREKFGKGTFRKKAEAFFAKASDTLDLLQRAEISPHVIAASVVLFAWDWRIPDGDELPANFRGDWVRRWQQRLADLDQMPDWLSEMRLVFRHARREGVRDAARLETLAFNAMEATGDLRILLDADPMAAITTTGKRVKTPAALPREKTNHLIGFLGVVLGRGQVDYCRLPRRRRSRRGRTTRMTSTEKLLAFVREQLGEDPFTIIAQLLNAAEIKTTSRGGWDAEAVRQRLYRWAASPEARVVERDVCAALPHHRTHRALFYGITVDS